ncbi:thioredoxin domain-containing protein [Candidatus Giovannonibacteria bacterium]|nr:thioredoxin domain-containing protein [Candidatus Giovannonibacteria bacterium]
MENNEENQEKIDKQEEKNTFLIPASIIFAGMLIAFSIYYTNGAPALRNNQEASGGGSVAENKIRQVDSSDHQFGSPEAEIKLVEYSDLECPFCKIFHETLKKIMSEYGNNGKVVWVYRHFPLEQIHPKAQKEAEASECAAELGGNEAFWAYIDKVFNITPSNNKLDPLKLPIIAEEIGLDKAKFESCLSSGKWKERVNSDYRDAVSAGGDGTPFTVLITRSGKNIPFSGALPYDDVKSIIDKALAE